jgi:hypothetical protein
MAWAVDLTGAAEPEAPVASRNLGITHCLP